MDYSKGFMICNNVIKAGKIIEVDTDWLRVSHNEFVTRYNEFITLVSRPESLRGTRTDFIWCSAEFHESSMGKTIDFENECYQRRLKPISWYLLMARKHCIKDNSNEIIDFWSYKLAMNFLQRGRRTGKSYCLQLLHSQIKKLNDQLRQSNMLEF